MALSKIQSHSDKSTMSRPFKKQFMFWLDYNNPTQNYIGELVEYLKEQRLFSKAIREGLQLWWSLYNGEIDVLLKFFPHIEDKILQRSHLPQRLDDIESKIDNLPKNVIPFPAQPAMTPPASPTGFRYSDDDEIDQSLLEVKVNVNAGKDAVENFLKSISGVAVSVSTVEKTKPAPTGNAKALDAPATLAAPSFDDEDDNIGF